MTGVTDPAERAASWLRETYGGMVELSTSAPVVESPRAWVFGCAPVAEPGQPRAVMLTSSVAVPRDDAPPFHLATNDPWGDLAALEQDPAPRTLDIQSRRTNARGCVVAVDAGVDGARASALPWQPSDEAPGWWERLVDQYFPSAEVSPCADWNEVIASVRRAGPDTRGVVWVRREAGGIEATGHLVYAYNKDGQVALLDGQSGGLARTETDGIRQLVLARFRRAPQSFEPLRPAWQEPARDLAAAIRKAEAWLGEVYGDQVALVDPGPDDELPRGWLFACNTRSFLQDGHWEHGMLDAALVVPKDAQPPFGLPNSDPWTWLEKWSAGGQPGTDGLEPPPRPGPAAWFEPTMRSLGRVLDVSEHEDWPSLLGELAASPTGLRAVVWVRRTDRRGRESVGLLLVAAHTEDGFVLIDAAKDAPAELESEHIRTLHLIRYQ